MRIHIGMACAAIASSLAFSKSAIADIFVCAGDSIRVFDDNAHGSDPPMRIITGSNTGINECYDVAFDIKHDEIYVATGTIEVFPAGASGNVAPSRQIVDSAVFVTAVAVDFQTDELFAGSAGSTLLKFSRTASGETTPLLSKSVADTPISIFVDRLRDELAFAGYSAGNIYFQHPATLEPQSRPTLGVSMAKGITASLADELFVGAPNGIQVYGRDGVLRRTIGSSTTRAWGVGLDANSTLWATFQSGNSGSSDQLIAFVSTGPTNILNIIDNAALVSHEARGIALSRAAGCGGGHVLCDSLFWDGMETRRD